MAEENPTTKWCNGCKQHLPVGSFALCRAQKDGLQNQCKECKRAYREANRERILKNNKAWYAANKTEILERDRQQYARDREKERVRQKVKRQRFKERERARQKRWYEENKERVLQRNRKRYFIKREEIRTKGKEYYRQNPDLYHAYSRNRRARDVGAPGVCTLDQWIAKCGYHGWRCLYCGEALTLETATVEHRKPLSRGGSNWPSNLGPACDFCNRSKHKKTEAEFRVYLLNLAPEASEVLRRRPRIYSKGDDADRSTSVPSTLNAKDNARVIETFEDLPDAVLCGDLGVAEN